VSANHNDETCGVKGVSPYICPKSLDDLTNVDDFGDYKGKDEKKLEKSLFYP